MDTEAMKKCRWVKPKVKIAVAFVEWTEARRLRQARFVGMS